MNQIKIGVILSYVNIFLTNVIGLILTPFIIRSLGSSEYGLYTLIGSFIAYLALMDFGLTNTIIRFVAKYRAEKNSEGEKKFLGSIFIIYFVISAILVAIGVFFYFKLDVIFQKSLTVDEIRKAKIMFQFLIFDLAIALPGGAFTAICNAYEYFAIPRIVSIIKYLFRTITILAVLTLGGKAISLVIIDTILNVLTILTVSYFVFKKLNVKIHFKGLEIPLVKNIFKYSIWIFIYVVIQTFQWNFGQLVLGINTNTLQVAIFGIGIMLGSYYGAFPAAINNVLLPRATQMIVSNNNATELSKAMTQIARINIMVQYLILTGFILFGQAFIKLWVGDEYKQSWIIALIVMVVLTIPLTQSFGNSILEAKNKVKFKAILNLITMTFGVFFGYYFSLHYGMLGIISSIAAAMLVNSVITNVYFVKIFGFEINYFFKEVFLKQTLYLALLTLGMYYLISLFSISKWIELLVCGFGFVVIYSLFYYFILMNDYEKGLILKAVNRKRQNK
ncbi:MAG: oligosaccharide flippase family protein [Flavobacterium sp.]|uniref:lipopolysaccharide biosynthesis protein n=1 Tax=Flavobacterium sp. TaxID=239 RepID=UPI0022BD3815|nr:oligosaccharide flippase family protein [Flavobacterium sp.]MCZ8197322.1 oligosaccharide flippase family protein [Flavobacterium sp.]